MEKEKVSLRFEDGELGSGKIFVPAIIDGTCVEFLFDTGATFTGLKNKSLIKNPTVTGTHSFQSASGTVLTAEKATCESFSLGSLSLKKIPISIFPDKFEHDTTIGINILRNSIFSFNSNRKEMAVGPCDENLDTSFLVSDKGHICLNLKLKDETCGGIWDTGAELTVVSKALVHKYSENFSNPIMINNGMDSTGSKINFILWEMESLEISNVKFEKIKVLEMDFTPLGNHFPSHTEMIIGYNLITKANWCFDMKNQLFSLKHKDNT